MTKNRSMKIAVLVLALALLTSCFVGSTFARYTSSGEGSATVTAAKWAVDVAGQDVVNNDTPINFELFKTITETDGGDEDEVAEGKIAPGTKGQFSIAIVNKSEVTVTYKVTLTPTLNGVPIKWSLDGSDYTKTIDDVNAALTDNIDFTDAPEGVTANTVPVYWMWDYNEAGNDNIHNGKTVTIDVDFEVYQAD